MSTSPPQGSPPAPPARRLPRSARSSGRRPKATSAPRHSRSWRSRREPEGGVGIYTDETRTKYRDLLDVLKEIQAKYGESAQYAAQYEDALSALFGPRQVTRAQGLMASLKDLDVAIAAVGARSGEADKM